MAEGEGIEPPILLWKDDCFQDSFLDQPDTFRMAAGVGVEPTSPGSEPDVLPLDYPIVVPRAGIEPATRCASSNRSTSELPRIESTWTGGKGGIRTHGSFLWGRTGRVATGCLKPLSHLSLWPSEWESFPLSLALKACSSTAIATKLFGTRGRTRTCTPPINSRLLYRLSYPGTFGLNQA